MTLCTLWGEALAERVVELVGCFCGLIQAAVLLHRCNGLSRMILISLWLWTSVFAPAVWLQKPIEAEAMRGARGEAGLGSPAPGHFLLPPEGLLSSFPHPSGTLKWPMQGGCFLE